MSWDMLGHEWASQLLQSHIIRDQIKHAYLIAGPAHVGKRTLAMRFVQALYCREPPDSGQYCGHCRSCDLISKAAHPDVHIVVSEEHDRALKVDQIRELQKKIHLAPYEGGRRVALLLRFHEATEQAAYALLKTLEEPPPQVILILTATSAEVLLPTIVSRCETIPLKLVSRQRLEAAFIDRGVSEQKARLLVGLSGGRPGWALTMLENPEHLDRRTSWLNEMSTLLSQNRSDRFAYVERWEGGLRRRFDHLDDRRDECMRALEGWLSYWRDIILVAHHADHQLDNIDRLDELQELAQRLALSKILATAQAIQSTMDAIAINANIRLALEALMLELPYLR
jgi:DNA polymerase-3 subunit delta'